MVCAWSNTVSMGTIFIEIFLLGSRSKAIGINNVCVEAV